jgi:hypothetical protein
MNSEHLCRVESVRARRRYACADRALTVLHEAKEAGEMAAACLRLKLPREHKGAKATFRYERDSILATACAQTGLPEHESHRYIRLPIVLTLHAGLPDKAGTTFDGLIESLMAQISAFLSVDTDNFVMQGKRITAPGSPGEKFEKGGGCLRKANSNNSRCCDLERFQHPI